MGSGLVLFGAALAWTSTVSQATSYGLIAVMGVVLGTGMGLTQAPATEAIMGAVAKEQAGIASVINGSTRLFGGTLGVAVVGSVAASLYANRLVATLPPRLPAGPSPPPRVGRRCSGRHRRRRGRCSGGGLSAPARPRAHPDETRPPADTKFPPVITVQIGTPPARQGRERARMLARLG